MVRNTRVSAGVDQTFSPRVRFGVIYAHTRGSGLLRGENLNAPVERRAPGSRLRQHRRGRGGCGVAAAHAVRERVDLARGAVAGAERTEAPRWNWKRTSFNVNYSAGPIAEQHGRARSACRRAAARQGSGGGCRRNPQPSAQPGHQFERAQEPERRTSTSMPRPARPTRSRPADDDNGDLVFNDRPAGRAATRSGRPGSGRSTDSSSVHNRDREAHGAAPPAASPASRSATASRACRRAAPAPPVPHRHRRERPEPDQPRELHRLHRDESPRSSCSRRTAP